jgi:RNA polymerase sigma-70 factor (ECF subfamily)
MVTAALPVPQEWPRRIGEQRDLARPAREPRDLDDAALAAQLAGGDRKALDRLYLAHRAAAFAVAYAIVRDPCAAEDVVHDAFLRAWRSVASYQSARGPLRSWLLTIVRNTAIDQVRARGTALRHQPRLHQDLVDADVANDVAEAVAEAADARRLRVGLDSLPVEQRQALELAFFAGLTHAEIAARTGAPLGTVKGRVRLGLRRLRQDLADLAPATLTRNRLASPAA